MSVKSNVEIWDALYSWIKSVLPDVEVVESHTDAPSPEGNFLAVDYSGTWHFAGTAPSKRIAEHPEIVSPRVYVYRGSVQIRDVDGNGENLMLLVESLDSEEALEKFEESGVSVLKTSGPVVMPALQQTQWRKESLLTLEMTWARAYKGSEFTIEIVEINDETYNLNE